MDIATPEPRILDVTSCSDEQIAGLQNPKLREIAEEVRRAGDQRPSAGHLNYFKTTK
jgi:hypothetical protein